MSIPVATYQCTACDFSGWDCVTWGYRYYQHGDTELPMEVSLGWCHACACLTALEIPPCAEAEQRLKQNLADAQDRLTSLLAEHRRERRWWPLRPCKSQLRREHEHTLENAQQRLTNFRQLQEAFAGATRPPRCLTCGRESCTALPKHPTSFDRVDSAPTLIGFAHPGCGGELTGINDGLCFNIRLEKRGYNLKGQLILPST